MFVHHEKKFPKYSKRRMVGNFLRVKVIFSSDKNVNPPVCFRIMIQKINVLKMYSIIISVFQSVLQL